MSISASGGASYALAEDGSLWAWGNSGLTPVQPRKSPLKIGGLQQFTRFAAGNEHALGIMADGTLWAWGRGLEGQLGDGSRLDRDTPVPVVLGSTPVVAVAAGLRSSYAVDAAGVLWVWGDNTLGRLGDGTTASREHPVQVAGLPAVVEVSAGGGHALARCTDGSVWAWGDGHLGQLGQGLNQHSLSPVKVIGLEGVIAVAAGGEFSLALKADGTVWGWGYGRYGALGQGAFRDESLPVQSMTPTGMAAIAAGGYHAVGLRDDGTVWMWGENFNFQLGDVGTGAVSVPVQRTGLPAVAGIAAGSRHCLALESGGTIWAWGENRSGQLGDGTIVRDRSQPVRTVRLGPPDLALSLSAGLFWDMGAPALYSITIENVGHAGTEGATQVISSLPQGIEIIPTTAGPWACTASGELLTCGRETPIPPDEIGTIAVGVRVSTESPTEFILAAGVTNSTDTNTENNTAQLSMVARQPTAVRIDSITPSPALVGQSVTVAYTVTSPGGTPDLRVWVTDGLDHNQCRATDGSCTLISSQPGAKWVSVEVLSMSHFQPSIAQSPHQVLPLPGTTTTTIDSILPSPSVQGRAYSVKFSVTSSIGAQLGYVTVSDGTTSKECAVSAGSCSLVSASAGVKTITVVYGGDTLNAGSSASRTHTVHMLPPHKLGAYSQGYWLLDVNGNYAWDGLPADASFGLGMEGTPFTGDWKGDGRSKAGVYANGVWRLDFNGNRQWDGQPVDRELQFGWPGAIPIVGDWNGDGRTKIGVYSDGYWFLDYNGDGAWDGGVLDRQIGWGWPGAKPIVGDWNGDGRTKIGVYSGGFWFLDYDGDFLWNPAGQDKQIGWGWEGVQTVVGDWNGDGRDKIGVYSGGFWFLDYDGDYQWNPAGQDKQIGWGWEGVQIVMGDWNGDGRTKIGVVNLGFWFLDYDGNYAWDGGVIDKIAGWGPGWTPVPGRW